MDLRYVLTTNCNANCYFCLNEYIGSKSKEFSLNSMNYGDMSIVAQNLRAEGCTITGGEPTLRQDLYDIVLGIAESGLKSTLVSNGYELMNRMPVWGHIKKLHVSYHTFDETEWKRISKVNNGPQRVRDNLVAVRATYPNLTIRLNAVARKNNSDKKSLEQYLNLAREVKANISVFQNGYLRLLKEIGRFAEEDEESCDFWDLASAGGTLVEDTGRIKTFDFDGVKIHLTYLSSEMHNGGTIWITPNGEGFADIKKRSPMIDFNPSLKSRDLERIRRSFLSLEKEARLLKETEQKGTSPELYSEYKELVAERKSSLDIAENKYFF